LGLVFLAIGIGVGLVGHSGAAAWLVGFGAGAAIMNSTSFMLRRINGVGASDDEHHRSRDA
jgi:hypothetical protein